MNSLMTRLYSAYRLFSATDDVLARWGGAAVLLACRLWISWQFFHAGLLKLSDWSATLDLFRDEYHVPFLSPELAAVAGAGGELFFPVLLVAGFLVRPTALGLFFVNLMAVISYPQLWQFDCPAAIQSHLYWGGALLLMMMLGGGMMSLDYFFSKKYPAK